MSEAQTIDQGRLDWASPEAKRRVRRRYGADWRLQAYGIAAIALAMLGTFFLVTHGRLGALSITPLALFWGLASAVAAAFNSIQPGKLLRKYGASLVAGL